MECGRLRWLMLGLKQAIEDLILKEKIQAKMKVLK